MKNSNETTSFEKAFPGQTPVTLKQIAHDLDRPIVVLRRWSKEKRFHSCVDTTGKPIILVPLSEVPKIAAMPKGKGRTPRKPWRQRAQEMARQGTITLLSQEEQHQALAEEGEEPFIPSKATITDEKITIEEQEHPGFEEK